MLCGESCSIRSVSFSDRRMIAAISAPQLYLAEAYPCMHPSYFIVHSISLTLDIWAWIARFSQRHRSEFSAPAPAISMASWPISCAILASINHCNEASASGSKALLYRSRVKTVVTPYTVSGLTYFPCRSFSFRGTPAATSPKRRTRKLCNTSVLDHPVPSENSRIV